MKTPQIPATVSSDFFNAIKLHVKGRLDTLESGKRYTARQLCGEAFWRLLDKHEPIVAGQCISFFAATKQLPFTRIGKNDSNAWLYQLN